MQVIDLMDKYDSDYKSIQRFYESIKSKIQRQQRFYCDQWWAKLNTVYSTTGAKIMRNQHALVMCYMLKIDEIQKPFNFRPPDGPMQWYLTQNQRLYYSDLQVTHLYGNNAYKKIQSNPKTDSKNHTQKTKLQTQKDLIIEQYQPFQYQNINNQPQIDYSLEQSLLDSYGNIRSQLSQYNYEDADKFIDILVDEQLPLNQQTTQYKHVIKWLCQRIRKLKSELQQVHDGDKQLLQDITLLD